MRNTLYLRVWVREREEFLDKVGVYKHTHTHTHISVLYMEWARAKQSKEKQPALIKPPTNTQLRAFH